MKMTTRVLLKTLLVTIFWAASGHAREIAPIEKALSLAQFRQGGEVHTMLILADEEETVRGVDLSAIIGAYPQDSLDLLHQQSYDMLAQYARLDVPQIKISHKDLLPTSGTSKRHVGVGINYPEHGREVALETQSFLFPKIVEGTQSRSFVTSYADALLDYEVELCARFDRDLSTRDDIEIANVGFFLCGDFTDRAKLMRLIDPSDIQSGIGFTDAKSDVGFFPTGPYLVVPRDWRNFQREIQLQLSVNGEPKQSGAVSDMIMPVDELAAKALEIGAVAKWRHNSESISLFSGQELKKGMAILTGTPEGVIFRPPSTGYKIRSSLRYFFTGGFLKSDIRQYVVERYIQQNLHDRTYLQPGDSVNMDATYLGSIRIKITALQ